MTLRSEDMSLLELKLSAESGWYFMKNIGTTGYLQVDEKTGSKNSLYGQKFEACKSFLSKLSEIKEIYRENNFDIKTEELNLEDIKLVCDSLEESSIFNQFQDHTGFEKMEESISKRFFAIKEISSNIKQLKDKLAEQVEKEVVISSLADIFPENATYKPYESAELELKMEGFGFYYICGVVSVDEVYMVKRTIFRLTKENVFLQIIDLKEPENGTLPYLAKSKRLVLVIFQGGQSMTLKNIILNVYKSYGIRIHKLPDNQASFNLEIEKVQNEIQQLESLKHQSLEQLRESLGYFTEVDPLTSVKVIQLLEIFALREKSIFMELTKFDLSKSILSAKIWIPTELKSVFKNEFLRIKNENDIIKGDVYELETNSSKITPPTYFKLNDLSKPCQQIVDTYGIPKYKEANPALFTIATFPYLFGVMFGDIGHGAMLFGLGAFLINFYDVLKSKGLSQLLTYRYLLTMMGFFSFFCGLVYNDFLGIPLKLFRSCYSRKENKFVPEHEGCTYTLGFDPVWYSATEEVSFMNSFKMKLSIIVGVIHMLLGIILKGSNAIYFSNYFDFIFEFLPQLIFMCSTFGYMSLAIIIKWLINWGDGKNAPSIISIFINMGVATQDSVLWGEKTGSQQTNFQQTLFLISFICFWVMLLPKPIILALKQRFKSKGYASSYQKLPTQQSISQFENEEPLLEESKPHDEEEHDIGELFVHQMIEVIEFVLGSISNTASYLRLWALSLAHGQLAKVFLDLTIVNSLKGGSAVAAVIGFPIFTASTIMVLMMMDLMECFLHTLRLHWVEFQNKFFKGEGIKFQSFNIYEKVLEEKVGAA